MNLTVFFRLLLVIFIIIITYLFSIYFTGRIERQYIVIKPDQKVLLNNNSINTEDLIDQYLPEIYILRELQDIKPENIYYEIIETNKSFAIVYRIVYPIEKAPSFFIHAIYSFYCSLYYGSKKDIEYIQINVNKETGTIERILFETSSVSPRSLVQIHNPIEITKSEDGKFLMKYNKKNNYINNIQFNNSHLKIAVITWNHLLGLPKNNTDYIEIESTKLSFLDEEVYIHYKMARRGAGDFKSYENFEGFFLFIILCILELWVLKITRLL